MEMRWVYNIFCGNLQVHVSTSKPNYMLFEVCTLKFSVHVMRLWSLEEEQRSRWRRWWWWWCGRDPIAQFKILHHISHILLQITLCKRHREEHWILTFGCLCGSFCFSICQLQLVKPFIMCRDKTQNKSSSIPPHNKANLHKVQEKFKPCYL